MLCALLLLPGYAQAQFTIGSGNAPQIPSIADEGTGPMNPAQPTGITPQEVIQKFTQKEAEFKQARDHYTWTQDIKVEQLEGTSVVGEFREVTDIVYDDRGRRVEHVSFAPQPSLQLGITKEDVDDLRHRVAFSLVPDEVPKYQILYVGQQKVDELDTYVFDVAPRTIEKDHRYFQGRIWVDKQDLQIVKSYGKSVPDLRVAPTKKNRKHPENENLFPKFVTYREQIDGKYWFPTYTKADEVLHFSNNEAHIREIVKYMNYQRFGSDVRILYGGNDITKDSPPGQKPATGSNPK